MRAAPRAGAAGGSSFPAPADAEEDAAAGAEEGRGGSAGRLAFGAAPAPPASPPSPLHAPSASNPAWATSQSSAPSAPATDAEFEVTVNEEPPLNSIPSESP